MENILGLTISSVGQEFVLHVDKENDYRFLSFNYRGLIIETILRAILINRAIKTSLPLFSVPFINLNGVMTTHSLVEKGKTVYPDNKYRSEITADTLDKLSL